MEKFYDNLFQIASDLKKPAPSFSEGDEVFITVVDCVFKDKVDSVFEITDEDDCFKEYGYSLSGEYSTVLWDRSVGEELFKTEVSAKAKASDNKYNQGIKFLDLPESTAVIKSAKIYSLNGKFKYKIFFNNAIVLEKDYCCYTFAQAFKSDKEAEAFYNKKFCKDKNKNEIIIDFASLTFEEKIAFYKEVEKHLYSCGNAYSSLGYFYNNYFSEKKF